MVTDLLVFILSCGDGGVICMRLLCSPLGSVGILALKGYVAERKGEREDMQDAHVILNDITAECQPLPSLM